MKTIQERIYPMLHQGLEVTFRPIDNLNPRTGIQVIIEGCFGRVSGDSIDSIPLAFNKATNQLHNHIAGLSSNVRPVLSLNQQVAAMTDSQLKDLADHIASIQYARAMAQISD